MHRHQNTKGTNATGQYGCKQNDEQEILAKCQNVQCHGSILLSDPLETTTNCEYNAEKWTSGKVIRLESSSPNLNRTLKTCISVLDLSGSPLVLD